MRARHGWLLAGLLLLGGCQNKDAEQLARLGGKLSQKAEAFVVTQGGQLAQSWPGMALRRGETALDARVADRLHWDRKLTELTIQVKADGGTIELQGKVEDREQRQRAVELAETTVGVEKVTDKMEGPE